MNIDSLTELQIDALREVGGVGAGHAATALSQLVDRPIGLAVPTLEVLTIRQVPLAIGGPEELVAAVYSRLLGDIEGGMLFMAQRDVCLALVDLMHNRQPGTTVSFDRDDEVLITHVASILMSAYLAAIARMADLTVLPSSPGFALDMAGAILEGAVSEIGMRAEHAILVRARFLDEDRAVDAALFFLPDPDSLEVILGRLGMA